MNDTILLLTYYYDEADRTRPVLRHVIEVYCPAYLPFDIYISEPLKKIFSRVIVYDFLRQRAEIGLKAMNEEVVELVRKERPKYVLWTSFNDDVQQSTLERIRAEGSVIVGWFFDDDWRFNSYSKYWAHYLDYVVTNSPGAVPKYQRLGARTIQTIPNTGVASCPNWPHVKENHDITFVGSSKFANRRLYINALKNLNLPIEIFGEGSSGYVSFKRMLDIFQTSKINLNFSIGGGYYRDRQIKGRIFQVCMAGGFLLTENTPDIEKYFEIDKEIVCFENEKEMIEKATYYLSHDTERRAIARAGWKKASREYSSSAMVAKVFNEIQKETATNTIKAGAQATNLPLPLWIRRHPTRYHLEWAVAYLRDNGKEERCKEALSLSLRYNRFNAWTWCFVFASVLPVAVHKSFFRLYRLQQRIIAAFLSQLQLFSFLRTISEPVLRKIW